jgi:hypothetical protein
MPVTQGGGVTARPKPNLVLGLTLVAACAALSAFPAPPTIRGVLAAEGDTLLFEPSPDDTAWVEEEEVTEIDFPDEGDWLRVAPIGDNLLTDVEVWRAREEDRHRWDLRFDYNRVDPLRLGVAYQFQSDQLMHPRLGARLEYSFGRERTMYGIQVEQPVIPPGRISLGVSAVRRTDHPELQQVEDLENSLALLFARTDYRDYFEREGFGAYIAWRVPDFSTVSVHMRNDEFRSLPLDRGTRSFIYKGRDLRENPAINDGESHTAALRLERLAHRTSQTRAGFYHWIDLERSGHGLGGDFSYTRFLADLRSVVRLSPATTLALRLVGGHVSDGTLPVQKQFTLGGADGLRAHAIASNRGDQLLLGQAEYTIGLWRLRSNFFQGGLHAIAFVDAGWTWFNPAHHWDVDRQKIRVDGGFGVSTSEDNLRLYFARHLDEPDSGFLVTMRLRRPF